MMGRKSKNSKSVASIAIGYVRVSTEEQAEGGVSLAAQAQAIRSYCQIRNLELSQVVVDAGVSAGRALETREGGARIIEAVSKGQVGAVVAMKLDRLFRNCADCLNVTEEWDKRGVSLHLIDIGGQSIDTSSAMGRFFLTVMAGAAELERNMIRERTSTAMAHKKANNERVGTVPFGKQLSSDGTHLEDNTAEQAVITQIQAMRDNGTTLQAIVNYLNENNVPIRGKKWHLTSVARLLKRAA